MPTLSLVVLGWNNVDLTERCLDSLRRSTDVAHELIVVDNGSEDGGADLAKRMADIAVLNDSNLGFAAGMNSGLDRASGRYIAFINNDTEFPPGWASNILETLESDDRVGIALPAVTAAGNPVTVRQHPGTERVVLTPFAEFPSGVVYVMPAHVIRQLGGWNEDYPIASAEDLDLAFTVWAHGLDIVVDERVLVVHESQASVVNLPDRKALYQANLERFLERWESAPFDGRPLLDTVDETQIRHNQERARTAVAWIRRMLAAREEAHDLRRRLREMTSEPTKRAWFRSRS